MSDLLTIAGNAVGAYQLALGTVSNNIANVSTDGYSRQEVNLSQAPPRQVGGSFLGTGVVYDRIKRQYDAFAELNLRTSTSELASQTPMVDYTNRVVDLMGSEDAGLSSALTQFFSSARTLSTDPASPVLRGQFLRDAQGLASRFQLVSSQLDLVDTESRQAIEGGASTINTLSQQLAEVNRQLAKQGSADRQPGELLDQRDRLLRELSQQVRLRTTFAPNGAVTVSLGAVADQNLIVTPAGAVPVGVAIDPADPGRVALVLDPYGKQPQSLAGVTSGQLGGLLAFREQVLGGTRDVMDHLAKVVAGEVNALHRSGVDGYGQKGGDLFVLEAGRRPAAGLRLAFSDAMRIAAAAQFRVIENANNAGGADASISFANPVSRVPTLLTQVLGNNPHPSASRLLQVSDGTPATVGAIPAGMRDVTVYLNEAQGDQQLQLMTRDGRHLLGASLGSDDWQLIGKSPALAAGATYSDAYLNRSGADGYRAMQAFYGARAEIRPLQAFDEFGAPIVSETSAGQLQGARLRQGLGGVAANAVLLNGVSLPALVPAGSALTAPEVAAWINASVQAQADGSLDGIRASAVNELKVPINQLRLDRSLVLNGTAIVAPTAGGFASARALSDAINARSASAGVQASVSADGQLTLTNIAGQEGQDILVSALDGASGNALNMAGGTYLGRVQLQRSAADGGDLGIELSAGPAGSAGLLSDLGFRRDTLPPLLQGASVRPGSQGIPEQALTLNGVALPALGVPPEGLDAADVATWLNDAVQASSDSRLAGVSARAVNELRVSGSQLQLDRSLTLNGTAITPSGTRFASVAELVEAINAQAQTTGVQAFVSRDGELVLTNAEGQEGRTFSVDAPVAGSANALGVQAGVFAGRLEILRDVANQADASIELGFGSAGRPSMLADLGFRTAAYLRGVVPDDVLVYVTDSGASQAQVSASYRGTAADTATRLRANPMEISFITPTGASALRYRVTDQATGTVLAERDVEPSDLPKGIVYQGLSVRISGLPRVGDRFLLDGNPDGKGNNDNVRAMAALESANLVEGRRTVAATYIDQVNQIGNMARQASIAKEALTVVRDQAEDKRDKVAGVNLDQEASDLIRYQQAYQASAKVMQMASQLFDVMLQMQ